MDLKNEKSVSDMNEHITKEILEIKSPVSEIKNKMCDWQLDQQERQSEKEFLTLRTDFWNIPIWQK